jgi:hypothetical protein
MTVGMVDCALCAVSKKAAEQAAQELAAAKAESTRLAALVKQHEQTIAQLEIARKQATDDKADAVRASEADKNTIRDLEKRLDEAVRSLQKSLLDSGGAASPPPPTLLPPQTILTLSAAAGAALPHETGAAQAAGGAAKAGEAGKDNKRKEQPCMGPGEEAAPAKKHKAHARYQQPPRPPSLCCLRAELGKAILLKVTRYIQRVALRVAFSRIASPNTSPPAHPRRRVGQSNIVGNATRVRQ